MKKLDNLFRIALPAYVGFALAAASVPAVADDTDIYINNTPAPESAPLVMFSIDYRSNLGSTVCGDATDIGCDAGQYFLNDADTMDYVPTGRTFVYFDVLRLALHKVLSNVTGVKVGLMMNHDNANNCAGQSATKCSNGGYIVQGFKELQEGDANGALADFTKRLFLIPTPQGNLAHSYQGKELYFEFFRYLTGQAVYNGHNGYTDYGDTDKNTNLDVDFPDASWDTTAEVPSEKTYISPLKDSNSCTKIFAINFMFQVSQQEDDSDAAITASKAGGGMAGINTDKTTFDDVIAYMNDADLGDGTFGNAPDLDGQQSVISYFITDKLNTTTNGYATSGGTQSAIGLTDDPEDLINTLTAIFKEILSVSTTFVAASVPVNVFNRAESLDNVFIALFQADPDGKPLWAGNLKKLKLYARPQSDGSKVVEIVDANQDSAISNSDGRIRYDAVTHWTLPDDLPAADIGEDEVDGADGRAVDRGAAGQRIPGFLTGGMGASNSGSGEPADAGPRQIFYDSGSSLAALNADDATATALQSALGASTTAEAKEYLYWLRGYWDPDKDGVYTTRQWDTQDGTEWILGDPLHSRPLPINYGGSTTNPTIYIAMASNDGYLHFFKNTNSDGTESGKEVWAFVPQSIMGEVPKLYENTALSVGDKHPYTVDGAPAVWIDAGNDGTLNGSEKAYLYFGLRRGGRALYALDITNPDTPTLAWKIDNTKAGFEDLGYTWSRPQVGTVDDYDNDGKDDAVIVFSGGYDPNKDARGAVGTDDSMGNAIYVVDADDGTLVWKTTQGSNGFVSDSEFEHVDMVDSIPSDVTVVDTNGDLKIDRILVGDTGGNIWRSDIDGPRSKWQTILLATVGRHSSNSSGTADDRRFFHKPDFVPSKDGNGNFDAVIIGSGDRPNPLDKSVATTPDNYMYMIKDRDITPPTVTAPVQDSNWDHESFADITDNCIGQGDCVTTPDLSNGWKLKLEVATGEKSLSTPLTLSNTIYFTTYLPKTSSQADTCGPSEGSGLLYAVSLSDGSPVKNYDASDDAEEGSESTSDRYTTLSSAGIPADVVGINMDGKAYILPPDLKPRSADAATRWRTFWYQIEENDL